MTPGRWGCVPLILRRVQVAPEMVAPMDQKRAFVRDWLDARDIAVTDPEQLRALILGMEILGVDIQQGVRWGLYPPSWAEAIACHINGLVAVLADYIPDEARS